MSWWLPDYEASDHEVEIDGLYDTVDTGKRDFPAQRTLVICFTNRCGSTFLGEALASTGSVKPAREYLNYPVVRNQSAIREIDSFDGYLIDLADRFAHRGILTIKAGLGQLYFLARLGFLGDLLKDPAFVLIERDDILAQAVSWAIALQTGQWKSTQDPASSEPDYSFEAIDQRVDAILAENAGFRAFFARNDCHVEHVRYEPLRARPAEVIGDLARSLELSDSTYDPGRINIAPQRSSINAEWKARYLKEIQSP